MAKTFMYWVIVAGAQPTAFRARRADDLIPTLRQLQRTQSDVSLKWFERGRFWESPSDAKEAQERRRQTTANRGTGWRPGGQHVDPRAKYAVSRDERRARFKRRLVSSKRNAAGPDAPAERDRNGGTERQNTRPTRPSGPRRRR